MTDATATTPGAATVREVTAATDDAMRTLGRDLAALARPGDVLILSGPLGAGKTTLTQGLGEGLGVRGSVTSPTFVISRIHPSLTGGPDLVHVDAYRLGGPGEIDDIDLDMTLPDSVTVVEWGEGVAEGLSDDRLEIRIERHPDDTRSVHLRAVGARWAGADLPGTAAGPR
ncbi:tRNA (adenosine(37)-N6)-threonylcarbamoyltransferase complex ATPase subunit type 1 TsaE [Nocardiopsis dassonvillei]|uniref:tRNA (adenosine(37)-N6)-threonylcarbamoyltransferase complex ATPase subunit type 1 TsaE n=1 Tax=Nocardiopsis TaxID=2013 RepID=UPI00200D1E76|nr:tRNA (adenosine(37)-N6)-threonylcarbamoyltransferase complex ATPase subunit type 1 TsaE [Nocardiopsis dassonvillei]MCK9870909.1 tRNA (adenosine(37)-N6)-threonylcarbamoyltransferase complex ATPase subunit type 1 TsaE [Nocardiopsis dassonvillei]